VEPSRRCEPRPPRAPRRALDGPIERLGQCLGNERTRRLRHLRQRVRDDARGLPRDQRLRPDARRRERRCRRYELEPARLRRGRRNGVRDRGRRRLGAVGRTRHVRPLVGRARRRRCHAARVEPHGDEQPRVGMVERQHVRVDWTGASDLGSGVDGFSYSWTQGPTGPVDTTKDVEETVGTATSPPLADGEWWFHLRTVDNAGNWSDLVQLGPFRIDTAAPSTGPPSSSTHMIGEWSTNATVAAAWTATDARSGVDGYFWEGSSSATTAPDEINDVEGPRRRRAARSPTATGGSTYGPATTPGTGARPRTSGRSESTPRPRPIRRRRARIRPTGPWM
jgi:hypothetical protein